MPELVVGGVRNAGVEPSLDELPAARGAQPASERMNVVVGVGVAERLSGAVEEVLPVNEDGRALDRRLRRAHGVLLRKKYPRPGLSACRAGSKYIVSLAG